MGFTSLLSFPMFALLAASFAFTLLQTSQACLERLYPDIPAQIMPSEGSPHERTWMAYGATISAWGNDMRTPHSRDASNSRPVARHDLMRIAAQLSRFEPVNMLVANENDRIEAEEWLSTIITQSEVVDQFATNPVIDSSGKIYMGPKQNSSILPPIRKYPINLIVQPLNDLWARDTSSVFVKDMNGIVSGVNFNFNGWGQQQSAACLPGWTKEKKNGVIDQDINSDVKVAAFINKWLSIREVSTWLTMEGGGIEINGRGLAIAAESCILNNNRNPGVEKIMWIPGLKGEDITDGHIDFYARFTAPNRLVYSFSPDIDIDNMNIFTNAVGEIDALSPELKNKYLGSPTAVLVTTSLPLTNIALVKAAIDVRNPNPLITTRPNFNTSMAAGYVGFYEFNQCIIMAQFGDTTADQNAFNLIQAEYPEKIIFQITSDGISNQGGSIHCSTQQQMAIFPNSTTTNIASGLALSGLAHVVTFVLLVVGLLNIF